MTRRLFRYWLPLALAALGGCYCSHGPGEGDAGADGGQALDGGPDATPDGGLPDAIPTDVPRDCSEVGGVRRCGASCPDLCPGSPPVRCSERVGLCLPRRDSTMCGYEFDEPPPDGGMPSYLSHVGCADGSPCAVVGSDPPSGTSGTCVWPELCDAAAAAGLDFRCYWGDGSAVTGAPPSVGACPAPAHPQAPFCGGPCPMCGSPSLQGNCIGTSETRGLGLCVGVPRRCYAGMSDFLWRLCEEGFGWGMGAGEDCACLVLYPQPEENWTISGFAVPRSSCEAYRTMFPGMVECRDETWVDR